MLTLIGSAFWDYLFAVDALPLHGQISAAELLGGNPAGSVPNSAAHLASQGEAVTLITRVGDDELGQRYRQICEQLPALSVLWLPGRGHTKLCVVFTTPDGERTIVCGSPSQNETSVDVTPAVAEQLAKTDLLWVMTAHAQRRGHYARLYSGKKGLPLIHFTEEQQAGRRWNYVVGSAEDAPRPTHSALSAMGVELCVITAGATGGVYSQASGPWQPFAAHAGVAVVDTTGAGDAFLAGLLAGLHQQLSHEEAIALGSRYGARAVAQRGSWPLLNL